jgi:hypothetical protein
VKPCGLAHAYYVGAFIPKTPSPVNLHDLKLSTVSKFLFYEDSDHYIAAAQAYKLAINTLAIVKLLIRSVMHTSK